MIRPIGPFRKQLIGNGGILFPPYFPTSLSHLEEYYDARTPALTLAHGANVDPWVDLSGNSRNQITFAPDIPPTLLSTSSLSPNGLPLVRFNGVNQDLASGTINPFPVLTRGYSFHAYANWQAGGAGVVWQDDTGLRPQLFINTGAGTISWRDTSGTRTFAGALTGFHLYSWIFDVGGTATIYLDGVALGSNAWTIAYNANAATIIGCNQVNNAHVTADEGFFVWYSDSHSAATIAQFLLWTQIFWGF